MEDPIVRVHQGRLRGINETNINGMSYVAFRGIPYAKPPVGNLRFKDSEPIVRWFGIRDAINFGNPCAQIDDNSDGFIGSDDCLYLNVYTQSLEPLEPKAVMFWIHGGSFLMGSGDDSLYGPDYLIEKDIVLVTINYRLGIFGFLNIDDEEAPGNQGLKDQVLALKWVQQNIRKFGGDPNNVTIFGHSAGSASIHYLTISPLSQGLFHKAILQSGCAICPWASLPKPILPIVKKLAAVFGKDISNIKEFMNYLRTVDARSLLEASDKIRTASDKVLYINPFIPTVDLKAKNPFLTKPIYEAIKIGIRVPSLCGYLQDEGLALNGFIPNDTYDKIDKDPENLLVHPTPLRYLKQNNITIDDIKRYYYDNERISLDNINKFYHLTTATNFIINIHTIIEIQSKIQNIPIYVYKFKYELDFSIMKKFINISHIKGTCHGDELNFLFYSKTKEALGKKSPEPGSTDYILIQRFTEMWTNFAKIGNPTPRRTKLIPVLWKPNDNSNEYKCLKITDKLTMGITKNIIQHYIDIKSKQL